MYHYSNLSSFLIYQTFSTLMCRTILLLITTFENIKHILIFCYFVYLTLKRIRASVDKF